MAAALARSEQRIQALGVTSRQLGEWYSDLMDTRTAAPAHLSVAPLVGAVGQNVPFMHLVPASTKLPPLPVNLAAGVDLSSVLDLKGVWDKAPIKVLVTLMAGLNFYWSGEAFFDRSTVKSLATMLGSAVGVGAASAAVGQRMAEVRWESAIGQSGKSSISARLALVRVMGMAAGAALAQSAFLCFDVVVYGFEAFEAFQAGDFDTFSVNLGLIGASVASIRLQAQAFRALRIARAAVIAGDAAAISKGLDVVPHLGVKLLGLSVVIVGGVIARLYTTDSPLEKWVKNSHFGIRPDNAWSTNYTQSMERLYLILFPVSFEVFRLRELHPYQGQVTSTYLMLNLPGENIQMTDGMIHFKGHEIWRDTLGYHSERVKKAEWTGENFDRHSGSRIPVQAGITRYRRVYHEDGVRDLWSIEGDLIYSPREGLTLPAVRIKDWAWI